MGCQCQDCQRQSQTEVIQGTIHCPAVALGLLPKTLQDRLVSFCSSDEQLPWEFYGPQNLTFLFSGPVKNKFCLSHNSMIHGREPRVPPFMKKCVRRIGLEDQEAGYDFKVGDPGHIAVLTGFQVHDSGRWPPLGLSFPIYKMNQLHVLS